MKKVQFQDGDSEVYSFKINNPNIAEMLYAYKLKPNEKFVESASTVDHPQHYGGKDNPYEVIKVIEAWGLNNSFNLGNCVKYIGRLGKKGDPLEDLKKARWYLDREISNLEKMK